MGIYAVIISEHCFSHDHPDKICDLLTPALQSIREHAEVWKYWEPRKVSWPTKLRPDPPMKWEGRVSTSLFDLAIAEINGPYGIWLEIGPRFCEIRPTPKWGPIIQNPDVQLAVTSLCEAIASSLGLAKLVYVPDSCYTSSCASDFLGQDAPLEAIIEWLGRECGPSASTLSSIHTDLSDNEMRKLVPNWDGNPDTKIGENDGYFVKCMR